MDLKNLMARHFKKFINIVHKNYQGQVAIFVALVFQIIFILFALMINVGLLIHHKINLQQSTDLAAYYGASKQAEMLNVIAHVNFQIRQAYKLLTWRYRVLGTFGMQNGTSSSPPEGPNIPYPIKRNNSPDPKAFRYDSDSETFSGCSVTTPNPEIINPFEMPFLCMVHDGFKNPRTTNDTFCKAGCGRYDDKELVIRTIPTVGTGGAGGHDTGITGATNTAITTANALLKEACNATGPYSIIQLAKFYNNYLQDTGNKMLFIKTLMANLSTGETELLDIEGNLVIDGVKNTLINNLTEANNSSFEKEGNIFETYNSLSKARGSNPNCRYTADERSIDNNLFAEINFKFIQYYLLLCDPTNDSKYSAKSIYDTSSSNLSLNARLLAQLNGLGNNLGNQIQNVMNKNVYNHTIGIEKNPWCSVYYGVKATTTPIIPFLPVSKITLHASSFAKPFGGSIGPRAYKQWPSSAIKSDATGGKSAQTDYNLPVQNPTGEETGSLKNNIKILLNYSNFIGDMSGLANPKLLAVYYDMLLNRSVATNQSINSSKNKAPEPNAGGRLKPSTWPTYSEWDHLTETIDSPKFDSLAYAIDNDNFPNPNPNPTPKNSFMRDIEISVVAPNQFENTYYSIEPDFYNVYVKDKLGKRGVLDKLKERAGLNSSTKLIIPKDFGDNEQLAQRGDIAAHFSVRNQLEVVQHVMRVAPESNSPTSMTYRFNGPHHSEGISAVSQMYFTYVPYLPGSLLTSWTMKDLVSDDFSSPTATQSEDSRTPFAECRDDEGIHGSNGYGSIAEASDPRGGSDKLPPTPGNCITGGRTGYSVKIVSPAALMTETVGGDTDTIKNPPTGFVVF